MDVDLGGSAQIPLKAFDADRLDITPAEVAVYVKQPDTTTLGPLTVVQNDLDRRWFPFPTTQTGQHRYRVVETATDTIINEGAFYVWPSYTDLTTLWAPSLTDVAGLVPTRTIDSNNVQQNTFTSNTLPTATQVTAFIAQIVAEVQGAAGQIPSVAMEQAKHTASLGVAWLVERTFPPTAAEQNVANDFVNDYRQSLKALTEAVRGAVTGARAVSAQLDSYTWPEG